MTQFNVQYEIAGLIRGLPPSQWETALLCNDVSHWLGAGLDSALILHTASPWASYQIRKIAGCACPGNAGNVFPATAGERFCHASRHVRDARAVMHTGIAICGVLWCRSRRKRPQHSRRMCNPQSCVSGKKTTTKVCRRYELTNETHSSPSIVS